MTTVYFRGGQQGAASVVSALVASLAGENRSEAARGVFLVIGMAALSDIQGDFVRKAKGETGEDGNRWPRLSPKTLAYGRRFGPGEQTQLKAAAGLGRANSKAPGGKSGLMTAAQLKQWRKIYASRLARFAVSMPMPEAKAKAAAIAWATLKAEGAKTKLEVYGNRPHEVLRDTGVLLNSLSVGSMSGSGYQSTRLPGGEQQIFELMENGVTVGTNVPYAASHHYGDAKRGIPARPIMPLDGQTPVAWVEGWARAGMRALSVAIEQSLNRGGVY